MAKKRSRGNGDGDIWLRKDKEGKITSYRGAYFGPDGKRRYVSGKTKKETRNSLRRARADSEGGFILEAENIMLAEYLNRWLNGPVKTKNLKPITLEQYQQQVRVHIIPSLGHVKLAKLSPELGQDFYDSKVAAGLKPSSVRYIHAVLHNALEHAHKRRLIPENVASKTDPPKLRPPEIHPLDAEQTMLLLSAARNTPLESKPLLKQAGLPEMTLHDLRHTCATLLLSRGVHPKFVLYCCRVAAVGGLHLGRPSTIRLM